MADSSHVDTNITTIVESNGSTIISAVQTNVTESSRVDSVITTGGKGDDGAQGIPGQGVPTGGTAGQVLKKNSSGDYDTTFATLTKSDVGLGNVDNTSDANKPVSTAQSTAIGLKADTTALTAHTSNTSNPHSTTKAQVGLGNADNTSDANKPVSTATQTALNLKANTSSLAAVALSGAYADLTGKPTIPSQFNPIAGTNMTITGTYPNMTFASTGSGGGVTEAFVIAMALAL